MSELLKIFITSGLTVIGGVFLFACGQIVLKFFIEPILDQRRLIGELTSSIIFYSNWIASPGSDNSDKRLQLSEELRKYASNLMAKTKAIPFYLLFEKIHFVIKFESLKEVSKNLIYLSNKPFEESTEPALMNRKILKLIKNKLGISID